MRYTQIHLTAEQLPKVLFYFLIVCQLRDTVTNIVDKLFARINEIKSIFHHYLIFKKYFCVHRFFEITLDSYILTANKNQCTGKYSQKSHTILYLDWDSMGRVVLCR